VTETVDDALPPDPDDAGSDPAPEVMTPSRIEAAAALLGQRIRTTPVLAVDGAELGVAGRVSLKLELLQHSGTFKARGALHFMLANPIAESGVTAASGGNHGVAVAWAAGRLGHRATIFVPTISAPAKVARLRALGADVVQTGAVYAEALAACDEHQAATGATAIHAYEAPDVMAGAGTTGRELEAQVRAAGAPALDSVLVACGGGGLVGGVAAWLGDRTTVVACETEGTAAWARAREAGRPVDVEVDGVAADALGASRLGSLAFRTLKAADARSVVVPDEAVMAARRRLWDDYRLVVEASAAVPVAAVLTGAWSPEPGQHTGIIVCGANTSPGDLDGEGRP
jgi:threonine dehydratase